MRWVPLPGAPGVATGVIAIGMVATCISTTTITSIRTTILIATSAARAATGSTIRNTAETHPMAIGKQRTDLVVRARAELVAIDLVALAEPVDRVE